ncbi:MAG TPA: Pvc16 family protein [Pyrinomonadaceae bacterium]|nr:Pvc16 family protein [Pyrinomonadaceae bacterium]
MFQDLDSTLTRILDDTAMQTSIVPPLAELFNAQVSFITPDRTFPPTITQATIDLFLYDVKENRELREPVPIVEKVGNSFRRLMPPVRVDCSYIVTAWSNAPGDNSVVEEHRLLAQALLWLTRFPTIPDRYLQGGLTNQPFPLATTVAQMDANKNAGEFWSALGIPPRSAFYLTVTIAMDLGLIDSGPLVTTKSFDMVPGAAASPETVVQIGGRIFGPPVDVLRAQATLVNAAAASNQATVTLAADAANFSAGDIVLLEQGATRERAVIRSVAGVTLTFEANLSNNFTGGIVRIGDLVAGLRTLRVADAGGLEPGSTVRITQANNTEEGVLQAVDHPTNLITLTGGLTNNYTMGAADAQVNLTAGVADALVDVVDAGLRTQSTRDGRYSFTQVPVGTHTVRAVAVGFEPKTQSLVVPALPENYDINLMPL